MDAEHSDTTGPATNPSNRVRERIASTWGAHTTTQHGQLHLHVGDRSHAADWRLDEETRAVGRRGIEQARAALRSARADHLAQHPDEQAVDHVVASSRRPTAA